MNCPRCNNTQSCKDGIVRGRQRYQCKSCRFRYTVSHKSDVKPLYTKRKALQLYLEGLGFRAIGRILNISYGTVYQWVKACGDQVSLPESQDQVDIVEMDEIHTYVGFKKVYCWIWIAVDRISKRFISYVCGDRSTQTGLKLWERVKDIGKLYCSDYWKSYEQFIPKDKHRQSKSETYTVEGYNSLIRHYLARFKRKGKCYSKQVHMIEKSLNLLMAKLNNQLPILI
ncbi:IS1 family transposase [Candidatus Amoebophilus asiaticus]|uniref:IS1 family transposase n=1 Tax=Candidatus Amoebophilus asiaticus TaxID=281120 RepID=UPI0011D0ACB8|nr:IS1 family transposase [Candidatus Amoebophilus asiaticus]